MYSEKLLRTQKRKVLKNFSFRIVFNRNSFSMFEIEQCDKQCIDCATFTSFVITTIMTVNGSALFLQIPHPRAPQPLALRGG